MAYVAPSVKKTATEAIGRVLDGLRGDEDVAPVMAFVVFIRDNPDKVRDGEDLLFCGGFGIDDNKGMFAKMIDVGTAEIFGGNQ